MYEAAKKHFKMVDPRLYAAARDVHLEEVALSEDLFRDIVWTITGQQLSSLAANAIFARFQALFQGRQITPGRILGLADEDMRACGLSGAKVRAIKSVARAVEEGHLDIGLIPGLSDEEVAARLTQVTGIGPWTAEMLLMFSLGRPDIFSKGDLGLKKGMLALYGAKALASPRRLQRIIDAWSPYRTYAARVLWKVADGRRQSERVARTRPS